jgi:glycosyltransferase involved in cell wall biosynthesis
VRYAAGSAWAAVRLRPRPDVIIGSSPNLLAPAAARMAAALLRRPWIFEVRDFWPSALVDLGALRSGSRTHRALAGLERRLYRGADAIVTVPPHGGRRLDELGIRPTTLVHIPNSTALAGSGGVLPATLEPVLERPTDGFVLVYAGQLGVTHDLATVIRAVARLREVNGSSLLHLRVAFVGDGVERQRTVHLAAEMQLSNVRFHDAVPKDAIPAVLDRADACLMAAGGSDYFKYGLSPNKLFDYFAAGKPVLIAANDPTVVDEAGAGLRYRPGDPGALADAIVQLMATSPEERAAMGARGRELVRTRYSVSAVADQYEALLTEVLARHRHT